MNDWHPHAGAPQVTHRRYLVPDSPECPCAQALGRDESRIEDIARPDTIHNGEMSVPARDDFAIRITAETPQFAAEDITRWWQSAQIDYEGA